MKNLSIYAFIFVLTFSCTKDKADSPILNAINNIVVCSGSIVSSINFSANTGGGEIFSWTNDNVNINLPSGGTGNISEFTAALNTSSAPIIATIIVKGKKNSVTGPAISFTITIEPEPIVNDVPNQSYYTSANINIHLSSNITGSVQTWTNSNPAIGIPASGVGDIIYTAPTNNSGSDIEGVIIVTGTINSCESDGSNQKAFTITIHPSIPTTGLIAYFPFNGNANDESGNGNKGSINGGVTPTTDRKGNTDKAFLFDGSSGYIGIPSLNNLPYNPITYSVWAIVSSQYPTTPGFKAKAIIGRQQSYCETCGQLVFYADQNVSNGLYDNTFFYWMGATATLKAYPI